MYHVSSFKSLSGLHLPSFRAGHVSDLYKTVVADMSRVILGGRAVSSCQGVRSISFSFLGKYLYR